MAITDGKNGNRHHAQPRKRVRGGSDVANGVAITRTLPDPDRAIYIDFEGNMDASPTFLGVLWHRNAASPKFEQYVFEEIFFSAADAASAAINPPWECHRADLNAVIERVVKMAEDADLQIVAYGPYELEVVEAWVPGALAARFRARYRDAKQIAKPWLRVAHPGVVPPPVRWGGPYTLAFFMQQVKYHVPKAHGPLLTGGRLTYVRNQLSRRNGEFEQLTPVAKGKWTKVLAHNRHDCLGMRAVDETAIRELGHRRDPTLASMARRI